MQIKSLPQTELISYNNLDAASKNKIKQNESRRNTKQFKVGDFVLMHRDDCMHPGKSKYEFQGPYEIMAVTPQGQYEIRRVGKYYVTKAAKEQLRTWPTELVNDNGLTLPVLDDSKRTTKPEQENK